MTTISAAAATITMEGKGYWADASGALVPVETIKPQDKLQDEMVRKIIGYGSSLSDQMGRFKAHTFNDVSAFVALLDQEYGAKAGGKKGNMSFTTFDGCLKVQVAVADQLTFGPELQVAKKLVDECLTEWGAQSRPELRAVVTRAFNVDREGKVNRTELFKLLRLDIADSRWKRAMDAIRDSMRVIGSKTYIRCYRRPRPDAAWAFIPLDLANAEAPTAISTRAASASDAKSRDEATASALLQIAEPGLALGLFDSLSKLTYDQRSEVLAGIVALHALQNTDPVVVSWDEPAAIASQAREIIRQAHNAPAGGDDAAHA